MFPGHPWLSTSPDPPPYSVQNSQAQVPAQAPGASTSHVYVLTLSILPVPAGYPLPPPPPNYPQLVPTAIQYHGLPVYGPAIQPLPPNSLPPSIPSIADLSIGTPQIASPSPEPRKPRVIFHMVNITSAMDFQEQFVCARRSDLNRCPLAKQQCLKFFNSFPHKENIVNVLCAPDTRACLTASWAFARYTRSSGGFDSLGRRIIPWDNLFDCPSKEDYPLNPRTMPRLPKNQIENGLSEVREKLNSCNEFYTIERKMPVREWWASKVETEKQRVERADQVRLDLYHLAKIPCSGGTWKDVSIGSCRRKIIGDHHIVIVSHSNFLNVLTHREDLPGQATAWDDLQYRSYEFPSDDQVQKNQAQKFTLYETPESKERKHVKVGGVASK